MRCPAALALLARGLMTCIRSPMAFETLLAAEEQLEDALAFGTAFCPHRRLLGQMPCAFPALRQSL